MHGHHESDEMSDPRTPANGSCRDPSADLDAYNCVEPK